MRQPCLRPESVSLRGACVPTTREGLPMATTVHETSLPDLGDLFTSERTRLRPAYGFDDVAIVPGVETVHPDDVDLTFALGGQRFTIPFVASAMDGVVDVPFAIAMGKLGGLAALNLEGLQTR